MKFLSDDWFTKLAELTDTYATTAKIPEPVNNLILNISAIQNGHVVQLRMEHGFFRRGHSPEAHATLTLPASFVKRIFFEKEQGAGALAFMSGQATVEGDIGKVMELQRVPTSEPQKKFVESVLSFTDK